MASKKFRDFTRKGRTIRPFFFGRPSKNIRKQREQLIVTVAALYATGRGAEVQPLLRSLANFVSTQRRFLEELFIHLSLVLGFPTMIDGLERLAMIPGPRKRVRSKVTPVPGRLLLERVYGSQTRKLLTNLRTFHPELPRWVVRDVYGKVYARRGMTLRERELCNVVVLLFQHLEKQLISHIRGVQRAGMPHSDLKRAVRTAMRVAGQGPLRASRLLVRPVVSQKKKM